MLILADDLTGANDVGAQFAKRGIRSIVLVEPDIAELPRGYDIVVVNTESRHVPASVAANRVRRIAGLGLRAGIGHFFKKTDSTLRGNIGAELKALMETLGEQSIPFVPAFPETGRTTLGGIHFVHKVPIAETEFSRDPLSPIQTSSITEVVQAQGKLKATSMRLRDVPADLPEGFVVFDCESREEMRAIAQWAAGTNRLRVLSGSAAFAEELPQVLRLRSETLSDVLVRRPILLVNGSLNPRSLEQISYAEGFKRIQIAAEVLMELDTGDELFEELEDAKGEDVLLYSAGKREEAGDLLRMAASLGCNSSDAHLRVARKSGDIVRMAIERCSFGTLVVFGGDTLIGIARACGWKAFLPRAEVAPGITVATPEGSDLTVISKAGGFGGANVVETIQRWVRERSKRNVDL